MSHTRASESPNKKPFGNVCHGRASLDGALNVAKQG
jgi:hypothetical protein